MSGSEPDPNSMVRRIEAFYRENPDEWLTWDDLVRAHVLDRWRPR